MSTANSTAAMAPRITVIDPRTPEKAKLRVAAYARVSSDSADQLNSYLAQVDFYGKFISANEDWELVDLYADEGLSGLEAKNRDEFNRMLADCRAGKIDRILCKSTSRFARNTRDYLQALRELLRLGVTIHFEKENLDTGNMTSEQAAAIYGAFAQMESTNHSSNMRQSIRMRMKKGIFTPSSVPYGYRLNGLEPEIIPEEAEIVQYIFDAYLHGRGQMDITKELNERQIARGHKKDHWTFKTVYYILTNPAYTGDTIWNKFFRSDTIPFQMVRNKGQRPFYMVEGSHPPLVSKEDFQRVQDLLAQRREQFVKEISPAHSIYHKHIFCGNCGHALRRKMCSGKVYWVCIEHNADKARCPVPQIPEAALTEAALRLRNKLGLYGAELLRLLLEQLKELRGRELRGNRKIGDIDREIAQLSEQNLVLTRLKSKGYVDSALYFSQLDELDHKLKNLRKLRRRIQESSGEDAQIRDTQAMLWYLEDNPTWQEKIDAGFFENLVEKIIVVSAETVKFRLLNGLELTEKMTRTVR